MTALVVVACHFKSKNELCDTTIRRLEAGLKAYKSFPVQKDVQFFVTGNVPYEIGSIPMSDLMLEWLATHGVERKKILIGSGVGTFSEARSVTAMARPGTRFIVVASDWYFWSGAFIWRYFACVPWYHRQIEFLKVRGTGNLRTKLFYAAYGLTVLLAYLFNAGNLLERFLTSMQSDRTKGFTWDGCGAHPADRS